jgi:hypothetical protein
MFAVSPHPAKIEQEKREKRESFFRNTQPPLCHVRTMFAVSPHPGKIQQEHRSNSFPIELPFLSFLLFDRCRVAHYNNWNRDRSHAVKSSGITATAIRTTMIPTTNSQSPRLAFGPGRA